MFPESFLKRINQQPYIDSDILLKALREPAPVSIRVNDVKWKYTPLNSKPIKWSDNGFYLDRRPSFTLDPLFHAGCYYPQESSSMFLEKIIRQTVDNKDYIRVLDLCGAPGGKSTHLSSLIGQNGLLVSNEVIRSRANILDENLTKWGLSNCIVTQSDPSSFTNIHGFFDIILVDAPCSGEGMFRDPVAINEWSEENTTLCSVRQKRILMDAWPSLKENGIMIYSTCTFNPGENEKNIKWLTGKHKAETVRLDISEYNGITEIDYEGIFGYGFYPGSLLGEGLFVSVLRKTSEEAGIKHIEKSGGDRRLSKEERGVVNEWTGFPEENLFKKDNEIISVAGTYNDYNLISSTLRIINPGTRILTLKARNFLPSHQTALSVFFKKDSFPSVELTLDKALNYLHRDNIILSDATKGWNTILYNGIPLGFINNLGNRVNNYYPVEWRIRMDISRIVTENIIRW